MADSCPPLDERLLARTDPVLQDKLLGHASECPDCRDWLDAVAERLGAPSVGRLSGARWFFRPVSAAAAALLALGGAWYLFPGKGSSPAPPALPAGEPIAGRAGEYAGFPAADRFLVLPDASRLKLEPGCRLRLLSPGVGERARITLLSGVVEADAAPGKGAFRIDAEAGEVQVLGTRLRVKTYRLGTRLPCLCTEVYEGKVSVRNGAGSVQVFAGERAAIAGAQPPAKQEIGADWTVSLGAFSRLLRAGSDGSGVPPEGRDRGDLLAAFLFGGRWKDPLDLKDSPSDPEEILQAKQALRRIAP